MVAKPKVKIISRGVVKMFDDVTPHMAKLGGLVVADAKANAPVASGAYRDSIHLEMVRHGDRTVAQIVADVPYAMSVEADTGNLTRSLDAAGGA